MRARMKHPIAVRLAAEKRRAVIFYGGLNQQPDGAKCGTFREMK
jgi:hypothetical protein